MYMRTKILLLPQHTPMNLPLTLTLTLTHPLESPPHPFKPLQYHTFPLKLHALPLQPHALPLKSHSPPKPFIAAAHKLVRFPPLDRHAAAHGRLRFARKLALLLLSKPRHFLPLRILRRCRRFLAVPPRRPLLPLIYQYPQIFQLYRHNAYNPLAIGQFATTLAVRLSPPAAALFARLAALRASPALDSKLSAKLQRLLMLARRSGHRILLSKLVHIAPDLGFAPNFRSRLCNSHPDRFRTVDTSYGRALELVRWDSELAEAPLMGLGLRTVVGDRIMDRPPKFKSLPLRPGLNLKRRHRDYLIRLREMPEVSPYGKGGDLGGEGGVLSQEEEEKRACAVVREVLGMTVEKRTLVDHLTHFRKEFGLPNQLRGMLVRHPEMFYVSVKGVRHSVFLVEAYDGKGRLLVEDELLQEKESLMELVLEGRRLRRERRRERKRRKDFGYVDEGSEKEEVDDFDDVEEVYEDDDFRDLFESGIGDDWEEIGEGVIDETDDDEGMEVEELWVKKATASGALDVDEDIGELEDW